MRTKRVAQALLFAALLAAVALGLPGGAQGQAYTWSTVTVDAPGDVGWSTSIAVDANGDAMISYSDLWPDHLKFAICDRSVSAHGNCDDPGDWSAVTVEEEESGYGPVAWSTSIALDGNGNPMIAYNHVTRTSYDLRLAICDRSARANGNCDRTSDWSTLTVDGVGSVGGHPSIRVDANGNPMISYYTFAGALRFAMCDLAASANGNCNQTSDWSTVTVDALGETPAWGGMSLAVGLSGDPMISYYDYRDTDLRFAICDLSASTNGNCDERSDWNKATVNATGAVTEFMSIAVDANGDPMISHSDLWPEHLKLAMCDLSASAHGNCDQTSDWSTVMVDESGNVGTYSSIAVGANEDPMISYFVTNVGSTINVLKFAICDLSASANGNCNQTSDWSTEIVDAEGSVGQYTSIAVDPNGYPMISYQDWGTQDLKFATGSPPSPPPPPKATATPAVALGQMQDCPQAGKWAISVWDGDDGAPSEQAFATCGEGAVAAAYYVDPGSQVWSRWFAGSPLISSLTALSNGQAVLAFGGQGASAATLPGLSGEGEAMQNCPQPGRWAISVWTGASGTATDQAVASCTGVTVDAAYWIDPETQEWRRYFAGQPEISNLATLDQMQGIIALGG